MTVFQLGRDNSVKSAKMSATSEARSAYEAVRLAALAAQEDKLREVLDTGVCVLRWAISPSGLSLEQQGNINEKSNNDHATTD